MRLGVRQQVLGRGRALSVGPLDAVHLDRGLGRVVDSDVHHGGRGLHWGRGAAASELLIAWAAWAASDCAELLQGRSLPRSSHPHANPSPPPVICPLPGTFC